MIKMKLCIFSFVDFKFRRKFNGPFSEHWSIYFGREILFNQQATVWKVSFSFTLILCPN